MFRIGATEKGNRSKSKWDRKIRANGAKTVFEYCYIKEGKDFLVFL